MTIAVDFDGVIHAYSKGWHDGTIYDPPMPGALDGLRALMEQHAVFVFTTRNCHQVTEWLIGHGFDAVANETPGGTQTYPRVFWDERDRILVSNRKLAATAYLDDRAVRFENWDQAIEELAPAPGDGLGRRMSTLQIDLVEFSAYIDGTQREHLASGTEGTYARVAKITEEAGELSGALLRFNGHNVIKEDGEPTAADIGKHMLSVAITALGAYEHWTGNQGRAVRDLEAEMHRLREAL